MLKLLPFSHATIASVLAFVMALGGYGGYTVYKDHGKYGTNFENRLHTVVSIVDGDTFTIEDNIRIRLIGVDAPESSECFGKESTKYLSSQLAGQKVLLDKDIDPKDSFDRELRYVFLFNEDPNVGNTLINYQLVRTGHAKSEYKKPNRRYTHLLQSAQSEAETEKIGMWKSCNYKKSINNKTREQASKPKKKSCTIKGNITKRYEKNYFLEGCPNYKRVKIDPRKGEEWFCTEKAAKKSGYTKSPACNNIWQTKN